MDYFLVILSIISVVITILAQVFENKLYIKYIKIETMRKMSGYDVAKFLLEKNDLQNIKVKEVDGYLTDCYDSKNKTIRLSKKVYNSKTIGAVAIASREVCYAIQEKEEPIFSKIQKILLTIGNFSSQVAYLAIVLGIIFSLTDSLWIGIIIEIILLSLQIVVIPLKIKTVNRALKELDYSLLLNSNELSQCEVVSSSVMVSYITKIITTLLHTFRLISMVDGNDFFDIGNEFAYFWIFILSSFLGFVVETIWCLIKNKKIESRKGVIYEPLIPIYGISGTLIVIVAQIFELTTYYEIFLVGFIISTIIEFVCSFLQEKIFSTKSWDYSHFPMNLGGRVNLIYSILFGIISLISYKFVLYPFLEIFMTIEATSLIISLTIYRFIYMIYDFIISFIAVYRMKERRKGKIRKGQFWEYIDEKYTDEFLKIIYENMVIVENNNRKNVNKLINNKKER